MLHQAGAGAGPGDRLHRMHCACLTRGHSHTGSLAWNATQLRLVIMGEASCISGCRCTISGADSVAFQAVLQQSGSALQPVFLFEKILDAGSHCYWCSQCTSWNSKPLPSPRFPKG